jgi:glycosyltransferase involved in cell wall biosynthesis
MRNAATLARRVALDNYDVVNSFSRLAYLVPILPLSVPKLMSYHREISARTTRLAYKLACGTLEFSAIAQHLMVRRSLPGYWHHMPNGVVLSAYDYCAAVAADAPLVFLGRIEEIKGAHLAIEVARRAGRKLILAGNIPPEHRSWFQAHIASHLDGEHIRYAGPVDDAQKSALLGSAGALLMPVLWEEPFGLVMIEAMACGTPVIGLRRGGVPEVVADGETGFVVDTAAEMVTAVERLPAIPRSGCRARVERLYSDRVATDRCIEIYAELIGRLRGDSGVAVSGVPQRVD